MSKTSERGYGGEFPAIKATVMERAELTLSAFLLARIEEDEAVARYATTRGEPTDKDFEGWWLGHYDHANRHSPARVLAECAAKRAIVRAAQHAEDVEGGGADIVKSGGYQREGISSVLASLAAVYASHPDFNPDWV